MAVVASLVVGYFISRCGLQRSAALISATVLFILYHYAAFQEPVQVVVQSLIVCFTEMYLNNTLAVFVNSIPIGVHMLPLESYPCGLCCKHSAIGV